MIDTQYFLCHHTKIKGSIRKIEPFIKQTFLSEIMVSKNKYTFNRPGEGGTAKALRIIGEDPKKYDLLAQFSVEKRISGYEAKYLLEFCNSRNRPISAPHVSMLQREMEMGRWSDDIGDVILFDTDGVLMDGQHRLMAVTKSKKHIKFVFKYNRPEEDRHKVDQGRPRVTRDTLDMDPDILHGTWIPSIYKGALLGQALDFKNKADWDACSGVHRRNIKLSPADAKEVYLKYKKAFDFVTRLFHEPANFYHKSGVIQGVFLRAYLNNPRLESCLEKIVAYLSEEERSDINLALLASDFKGKFILIGSKTVKSRITLYGLTEKLILLFSQYPDNWKGKAKLTASKDELFPFPAFDMKKPGDTRFISGVERRRKAKESLRDLSNSFDDDMDDVA